MPCSRAKVLTLACPSTIVTFPHISGRKGHCCCPCSCASVFRYANMASRTCNTKRPSVRVRNSYEVRNYQMCAAWTGTLCSLGCRAYLPAGPPDTNERKLVGEHPMADDLDTCTKAASMLAPMSGTMEAMRDGAWWWRNMPMRRKYTAFCRACLSNSYRSVRLALLPGRKSDAGAPSATAAVQGVNALAARQP